MLKLFLTTVNCGQVNFVKFNQHFYNNICNKNAESERAGEKGNMSEREKAR